MSKVLVDPAALEEAAKWLEVHSSSSGSAEAFAAEALREAIAQPAEAEEVELQLRKVIDELKAGFVVCQQCGDQEDTATLDCVPELEAIAAALSAVTAERDRLLHAPAQDLLERLVAQLIESGAENYQESVFDLEVGSDVLTASVILRHLDKPGPHELRMQAEAERDQLRAEVEMLRPIHAMILNALDRDAEEGKTARGEMAAELRAAMAAKEE